MGFFLQKYSCSQHFRKHYGETQLPIRSDVIISRAQFHLARQHHKTKPIVFIGMRFLLSFFLLIVYMSQPLLTYDILNPLKIMLVNYPFFHELFIRLSFFRQYFFLVWLLLPLLLINHSVCSIFLSFLFSALNFVESKDGTRIESKERMRKWVWSKSDSATSFIDSTARTILLLLLYEFGLINLNIFFPFSP